LLVGFKFRSPCAVATGEGLSQRVKRMSDEKMMKECPTNGMTEAEKKAFIQGFEYCEESIWWGPMTNDWPHRIEHGFTLPPAIVEAKKERLKKPAICWLADRKK